MSLSDLSAKWNPKNLEIKTRSVEKTLEPLVIQVKTLFKHIKILSSSTAIWSHLLCVYFFLSVLNLVLYPVRYLPIQIPMDRIMLILWR